MAPLPYALSNVLTAISPHEGNLFAYAFGVMVAVYLATSLTIVVIYYRRNKKVAVTEAQPETTPQEQSA